ncbi:hypothetical protein THIOM_000333 [Candidatus Thiomargarita nelsonii]|uniref:Uncharacterized protein n=1 Tax=Candidatus Thiomargarita nelsonii TaxID=1003181 RepID=A0A176S6R0_9GAMM|nr:hypothetical protein THIOM_000333 [Candidatus Thiomargarita nelsonii]
MECDSGTNCDADQKKLQTFSEANGSHYTACKNETNRERCNNWCSSSSGVSQGCAECGNNCDAGQIELRTFFAAHGASYTACSRGNPNFVSLSDFSATALETGILLEWQTVSELDNAGFHLWRATGEGWKSGDYSTVIRLTEKLLPAQGNWSLYSYIDANVESGVTYYYALEDLDLFGHNTLHFDYIDSATAK